MIKRTIEISREPVHLAVNLDQLLVQRFDQDRSAPGAVTSIPCEDIGLVMVDHPRTTYTHQALAALMRFGAAVVVCGRDHLPAGLLLPMSSNTQVVWRIQEQVAAPLPLRKQLWKQLVIAKVRAQAAQLTKGSTAQGRLRTLTRDVKSGDTTNIEGQAARIYWAAWLDGCPPPYPIMREPVEPADIDPAALKIPEAREAAAMDGQFQRDQDSLDPINVMLNYGYAVLRAAVARALVSAGLFPALGVHHCNRSNAFCLADDLVEPLRPLIDARVRELHKRGRGAEGLDQPIKAYLLAVLAEEVRVGDQAGPLMVELHRVTASLVRCFQGESDRLNLPEAVAESCT